MVEPNPISFKLLKKKHRKSFAINSCISTTSHPDVIDMRIRGMGSTVIKGKGSFRKKNYKTYGKWKEAQGNLL